MRLRTLGLIVTLALGILIAPLAAAAQQPAKVPRVGVLVPGSVSSFSARIEAFRQALRELGYVEGQNIGIEYRYTEGKLQRLPDLAADLVRLKVDVIVTASAPAILAAKSATNTIPIVMAGIGDPLGTGVVSNLARPGGNITGLSLLTAELAGKRLEVLKEVVPGLSSLAVLWNPANPVSAVALRETELAAGTLAVRLQKVEVRHPDDFTNAFSAITGRQVSALFVIEDPLITGHRTLIAGYYDRNPERARDWLDAARRARGTIGIMYTSWHDKYEDLEKFAGYVNDYR